jgi:hypothetical protein
MARASNRPNGRVCGPRHQPNGPTTSLSLSCWFHYLDERTRFSPPHAIEAEGPQPAAAGTHMPFPILMAAAAPYPIPTVACFLSFPSGDAFFSPMDSAAIPSLPPQWWRWQQAASHLPSMVATAGIALPPRGSRSNSHGASRGCGGAQFAVVMRSTASCPPGRLLRAASKLYTNEL